MRRRPYQVILFDEVEKAHPEVFNALLQILDDGRLTDGHGRTVDFRNTVIIMTSNVGSIRRVREAARHAGLRHRQAEVREDEQIERRLREELKKTFRPEFLNRIDEVIVFHRLPKESLYQVVDKMLGDAAVAAGRAAAHAGADRRRRASGWSRTATTRRTVPVRCGG